MKEKHCWSVVYDTTVVMLHCPSCKMEMIVRLEVRGERSFADVVKEGKQEGSWVGKKRPDFKINWVKFKIH